MEMMGQRGLAATAFTDVALFGALTVQILLPQQCVSCLSLPPIHTNVVKITFILPV